MYAKLMIRHYLLTLTSSFFSKKNNPVKHHLGCFAPLCSQHHRVNGCHLNLSQKHVLNTPDVYVESAIILRYKCQAEDTAIAKTR